MKTNYLPSYLMKWIPAIKRVAQGKDVVLSDEKIIEVILAAENDYKVTYSHGRPSDFDTAFAICLKKVFFEELKVLTRRAGYIKKTFVSEWVKPKTKIMDAGLVALKQGE